MSTTPIQASTWSAAIVAHPESERQANLPIASLFRAGFDRCIEGDAALLLCAVHLGLVAACGRVMGAQRCGAPLFFVNGEPQVPMLILPSHCEHHERLGSLFAGAASCSPGAGARLQRLRRSPGRRSRSPLRR